MLGTWGVMEWAVSPPWGAGFLEVSIFPSCLSLLVTEALPFSALGIWFHPRCSKAQAEYKEAIPGGGGELQIQQSL